MVKPVCESHSIIIIDAHAAAYQARAERIAPPGLDHAAATVHAGPGLYYTVVPSLLYGDGAAHIAIMAAEDALVKYDHETPYGASMNRHHRQSNGRTVPSGHSLFDFSTVAERYEHWYRTSVGRLHDRLQRLAAMRLLRPGRPGERLLDVGCGTGHWSRFFASYGYAVVGVDISEEMIRVARRLSCPPPGCTFEVADACALPFGDGTFQVVAAMATLEFVSDVQTVVAELVRCVAPGGSVLIGTLNRLAPINRHRLARARQPYASARMLTATELRRLLGRFGPVNMACADLPSSMSRPEDCRGPFIVASVRP